jgi:hypothetical protein
MNVNDELREVVCKLARNTLALEMAEIKKQHPRWSNTERIALADPEVSELHRRERCALAYDRRDEYAKLQTGQPGDGSPNMPPSHICPRR